MGYTRTEADHAVFVRFKDGLVSTIVVYVDNFTMVCKDIKMIENDKEALMKAHDMMDLGEIAYILGIHVKRDREAGRIELSQQRYMEDILECFGKTDVCPISTPALTNEHLKNLESPKVDAKSYQCALGALMYLMLCTCPDFISKKQLSLLAGILCVLCLSYVSYKVLVRLAEGCKSDKYLIRYIRHWQVKLFFADA